MIRKILTILILFCISTAMPAQNASNREAHSWADSLIKAKGIKLKLSPITDFIELRKQYSTNKELWDKALDAIVLADKNLTHFSKAEKKEIVEGKCNITVSDYTPKSSDKVRLEGHKKFIDIQISTGNVMWGIYSANDADTLVPYNAKSDNGFYKSNKTRIIEQKRNKPHIYIFFPADLHIPSYAKDGETYDSPLKKVVIKIANSIE